MHLQCGECDFCVLVRNNESSTAVPNLGYARHLKGYARFKSYSDLSNIYFLKSRKFLLGGGYVSTKRLGTAGPAKSLEMSMSRKP